MVRDVICVYHATNMEEVNTLCVWHIVGRLKYYSQNA